MRVWSIDTLTHLYTFELPIGLVLAKVFNGGQSVMVGRSGGELQSFHLHIVMQGYMNSESTVKQILPLYTTQAERDAGQPSQTISLCDDNSAYIKPTDLTRREYKTTLYPPPGAQVIRRAVYSQALQRIIVMLQNSSLCTYRIFRETALLEKLQECAEVKDSEGMQAF